MKEFLRTVKNRILKPAYGWFGNFRNWEEANKATGGYNTQFIVDKVKSASLKVKHGEAAFERDSVLFYHREYSWPVVSALLWSAAQNHGRLRVMDFGGALGSTYYQYKHLFDSLPEVKWCIVEQTNFVDIGKADFETEILKFYPDIESCLASNQIDIFLCGCVLPYLREPYAVMDKIMSQKIPLLIIDRMPFIDGGTDRLTIQKVPPQIYDASYPSWFFSYTKFTAYIQQAYSLVAEYDCADRANIKSSYKGLILKSLT